MCGRYVSPDEAAYEREWSHIPRLTNIFQSFNVAPSTEPPVILNAGGIAQIYKPRWQFQRRGSDKKHVNARAETVFEKWTFRESARDKRCIVPVAGWYEWDRKVEPRQPYYHSRSDGRSFGLAGIWAVAGENSNDLVMNFCILTVAANEWAAPIHHRMPLILQSDNYDAWLARDTAISEAMSVIDKPFDDGGFEAYPVSRFVNKPGNDSPECIKRVAIN